MPTLNITAEKWHLWFQQIPTWPDFLTKPYWDKHKSIIAKIAGATGMGDQLKTCETAFKTASLKMPFLDGARKVDLDKSVKDCTAFISDSAVKTLHAELKALRDTAKAAAADCKKNKLIPKGTTQLCVDIADAADTLMVSCNPNSLSGCISTALKARVEANAAKQRKMADPVIKLCKGVPAKILGLTAGMRKVLAGVPIENARSPIGNQLFTCARDMTQPLGNLIKCASSGVDFDHFDLNKTKQLAQTLVPYGNGKAADCANCAKEEIEAKIQDIEDAAKEMGTIVATIAVAG